MTEPPNTEALLATVREFVTRRGMPDRYTGEVFRALDAIVSELRKAEVARIKGLAPEDAQRYFDQRDEYADRYVAANDRAEAAEAELERVRAERDALENHPMVLEHARMAAIIDRAVEALRELKPIATQIVKANDVVTDPQAEKAAQVSASMSEQEGIMVLSEWLVRHAAALDEIEEAG